MGRRAEFRSFSIAEVTIAVFESLILFVFRSWHSTLFRIRVLKNPN